ncbi:receptor like protein 22-like [Salvia miltiorrhiza]|uniref:receptor like protein 22-like n=1 Tax=Salvia miltiorrhiza TaxID=226208 RepID=UPI0025ABB570|nr:receptor like protein 22-like [Salvia miltiorrhiza]
MTIYLLPQFSVVSLILITIISTTNSNQCLDEQKILLLELKNNLTFDSSVSRKLVQWDGIEEDCCKWEGVECDAAGHVINLQLDYESLSGMVENLSTLSRLIYLERLNLAYNSLNGSIPPSLFGLPLLQQLKLNNNNFSGEFPSLTLSHLEELDLSNNRLEGPIPDSFFKLESLQLVSLSNNFFNDTFQLGKMRKLRNLTTLDLSYNNLSVDASSINSSFPTFPQFYQLSLVSCNLSSFPDLRNQSNLRFLDLSNNRIGGEIPNWIWGIGSGEFWQLNLSCNHFVDLQKPYRIPDSLQVLDLHSNHLRGELPLPQERALYVDYSNNKFDKPIPINIGNYLSNLIFFSVSNNSLSGSIPTTLCRATYLQVLDLSFNNLSGNMPPCLLENTQNLGVFILRSNNITGDIPDKFSNNCGLQTLDLNGNNLGGKIPKSMENCSWLSVLNLGNNKIDDSFPCMLPSSLRVLVLRSNRFHGEIRCNKDWPDLQIIDVSSNSFTGSLYQVGFSRWSRMVLDSDGQSRHEQLYFEFLNLKNLYYQDEVTLTIKGTQLKLVKIWSEFTSLDFSCNKFQGGIPEAIGDLSSLYLLNLSHNALTGTIPKSLGNMVALEALDLSLNQLTGMIPEGLRHLGFLQVLNLSYNKLVGRIPYSYQLATFDYPSYEGNEGLCGFPLNISCSNHENMERHEKPEIEWNYISAEIGYAVGFGSIIWLLVFFPSLRESYFGKVDEVFEMIIDRQRRKRSHERRRRAAANQVRRQ